MTPPPGLTIHRSNRLEALARCLTQQMEGQTATDPLIPVEVMVGSRGMERWLRQEIGAQLGVCCNVAFRFLAPWLARLERAFDLEPEDDAPVGPDPWQPDTLAWRVLKILEDRRGEAGWREVDEALSPAGPRPSEAVDGPRYAFARRVADLLDRYLHERPEWFGEAGGRGWPSGGGWQQALFADLERDLGRTHFPARVLALRAAIRARGEPLDIGALHVFGLSSLPPVVLDLLDNLSAQVPVHLYLLAATEDYLGDLVVKGDLKARQARAADLAKLGRDTVDAAYREAAAVHDPLLVSLGRMSRAMQLLCLERLGRIVDDDHFDEGVAEQADTVLGRLQRDLRQNASQHDAPRSVLRDDDASLAVHACFGATRQVEALREDLLHLFANDPSLQPRDVVVMTPDIETYAPIVQAVFAQGRDHRRRRRETGEPLEGPDAWGPTGAPRIPVEIADLGLRQTNALADVLLRLLELVRGRLTASAFDGLLGIREVQRRFGLDDAGVERIRGWLGSTGIRWALDAEDRCVAMGGQDAPLDSQNTFAFGLERLAVGVVMADDGATLWRPSDDVDLGPPDPEAYRPRHGVLPVDDMEGESVDAFGAFADLVRTIARWRGRFGTPMTLLQWCAELRDAMEELTDTSAKASWLRCQVEDLIAGIEKGAAALYDRQVAADAVAALIEGQLDNPRKGDRVVTGAVTLCALQPMRSVPFRVICLLGMEEDVFPRRVQRPGFDLAAREPRLGDRDPRDEDRHLLLEALLSARDHLHVFYTGRDVRTKAERPLAVPVAELLEAVDARFEGPSQVKPSRRLTLDHALQPFSLRNFATGDQAIDPRRPGAWSFDRGLVEAAEGLRSAERRPAQTLFAWRDAGDMLSPPTPAGPLGNGAPFEIPLDDLAMFAINPAEHLLRRRLSVYLGERDSTLGDREPIDLDWLEKWSLGDRLLRACVEAERESADASEAAEVARARMRAEGVLPLGAAGEAALDEAWGTVEAILEGTATIRAGTRRSVAVSFDVPRTANRPALRLVGSVDDVFASGEAGADLVLLAMTVSDLSRSPRHKLRLWVRLLAAQASCPGERLRAELFGKKNPEKAEVLRVHGDTGEPPLPEVHAVAGALLERLLDRCFVGLTRPTPLFLGSSYAFAKAETPDAGLDAAVEAWAGSDDDESFGTKGDSADAYIGAVWGADPPFIDEAGGGVAAAFAELSRELWGPILPAKTSRGAR